MRNVRTIADAGRRPAATRILMLAVAAVYIAAAVGSSALHVHSHGSGCCPSTPVAGNAEAAVAKSTCSHRHCSHSQHQHEAPAESTGSEAPCPAPLHDDDCSACQFLAKQQLSPEVVTVAALVTPVTELIPVDGGAPPHRAPLTHRSRGPPRA